MIWLLQRSRWAIKVNIEIEHVINPSKLWDERDNCLSFVGHNGHTERGGESVHEKFIIFLPYFSQIFHQMH